MADTSLLNGPEDPKAAKAKLKADKKEYAKKQWKMKKNQQQETNRKKKKKIIHIQKAEGKAKENNILQAEKWSEKRRLQKMKASHYYSLFCILRKLDRATGRLAGSGISNCFKSVVLIVACAEA